MDRQLWYDRNCNPISAEEANEILASTTKRRVALDEFHDGWVVSTVFLVIDHNWMSNGPPVLFETMVFTPGGEAVAQKRYSTEAEAIAGHDQLAASIRDKGKQQ